MAGGRRNRAARRTSSIASASSGFMGHSLARLSVWVSTFCFRLRKSSIRCPDCCGAPHPFPPGHARDKGTAQIVVWPYSLSARARLELTVCWIDFFTLRIVFLGNIRNSKIYPRCGGHNEIGRLGDVWYFLPGGNS